MIIFDLTRTDWKYKGVLFAEIDNNEFFKDVPIPIPNESMFHAGIMAIIYIDENEIWRATTRIKFLNGNKQVLKKEFGKEADCTSILQILYSIVPMKNKTWTVNPTETPGGIYDIIENLDMIESLMRVKIDNL